MSEKALYPLTSGQMILFYSQKYCSKKQINNICATIHITSSVDEDLLHQALMLALMRSPSLNCRFTMKGKDVVQYFCRDLPQNVEIVDMTQAGESQIQQKVDEWSAQPFPNKGMDVPLYRVKILQMPDGTHTLYLCICHLIMDAYAIVSCITYMGEVYEALQNGKPLPPIKSTPLECYQADYDYFASNRFQQDEDFWAKHIDTEPTFTSVNGAGSPEFDQGKKTGITLRLYQVGADHLNLRIPKDVVSAVSQFSLTRRISPQCAYLLAIRSYLSAVSHTDDVTIMNTVARRATLIQKHAGGSMVNAIPFRSIISGDTVFSDAMNTMFRIQREIYRHSDYPCGKIMDNYYRFNAKSSVICHAYSSTSFTFQPFFEQPGNSPLEYTFRREKNGAATIPLYISIMPYDSTGDLWANYEYIVGYIRPENIRRLHDFMVNFLRAAIETPEKTISQLTESSL